MIPKGPPVRTYLDTRFMFMAVEAKRFDKSKPYTLLTKEHFQEMINFEEWLSELEYPEPPSRETANIAAGEPPTMFKYKDLCGKENMTGEWMENEWTNQCNNGGTVDRSRCGFEPGVSERCAIGIHPLKFIYDRMSNRYALDQYDTDDDLVRKIQSGKGDELFLYYELGNNIFIEAMFGGTSPKLPKQDYVYGDNDLKTAKAYRY